MSLKQLAILCLCITSSVADELTPIDVREMDAVPEGNYLTILSLGGNDHRLNLEVDQGAVRCMKTDYQPAADVRVSFQTLSNGVFLASMRGEGITKTQF